MASLMMQKAYPGDATVTVCHSRSNDLVKVCQEADIIIAALGQPNYVKEEMLKEAGKNAGELAEQITWKQMDAQKLDFEDETFDPVVSRNLTWNLEKPEKAYEEWMRVLKPGGKMLNYDANWYHHLFDKEKRKEYEEDRKRVENLQMEDHYTCTDIDAMEEIAREVPLSQIARPKWDLETLKALGYEKNEVEENVWKEVWSQEERANYQSTPMFLIISEK